MTNPATAHEAPTPKRAKGRRTDLECNPLDGLCWKPGEAEASLAIVFNHVRDDAADAINWYRRARKPKRLLAISTRTLAITLFGAAAALPLIAPLAGIV